MNKERRKRIQQLIEELNTIQSSIEDVAAEERDFVDNMPENMHGGDKYSAAECAADALESAGNSAQEALDSLQEAMDA